MSVHPINKRYIYKDGHLIDTKHNLKNKVGKNVYIYDSENDELLEIPSEDLNIYIAGLPKDTRHWIEMTDIPIVRKAVVILMPRSKYALF